MATILLAGLGPGLEISLHRALAEQGYDAVHADAAADVRRAICSAGVPLIILGHDLDEPNDRLCAELRAGLQGRELLIILAGPGALGERLRGLAAGADDCVSLPFHMPELILRIQALLGRSRVGTHTAAQNRRQWGPLSLDVRTGEVWLRGQNVTLTPVEVRLLDYLMGRVGQPVSAEELLCQVWRQHPGTGDPALVRVHMHHLRLKLESDPSVPRLLKSIPPLGYCLSQESV